MYREAFKKMFGTFRAQLIYVSKNVQSKNKYFIFLVIDILIVLKPVYSKPTHNYKK